MVGWIVAGVVVVGVVMPVTALMSLGGRARPLRRAARRLQLRTEQAQGLQSKATAVQQKAMALQDLAARLQRRS